MLLGGGKFVWFRCVVLDFWDDSEAIRVCVVCNKGRGIFGFILAPAYFVQDHSSTTRGTLS